MLHFFSPALDNRLTGSATYLETLQTLFAQDESSGLIEINVDQQRQVMMLLNNGRMVAAYLVDGDQASPFGVANLARMWSGATSPIRYLQLPPQAVRAAWQALEWYPLVGHFYPPCQMQISGEKLQDGFVSSVDVLRIS